jgi:hypothetical protein
MLFEAGMGSWALKVAKKHGDSGHPAEKVVRILNSNENHLVSVLENLQELIDKLLKVQSTPTEGRICSIVWVSMISSLLFPPSSS